MSPYRSTALCSAVATARDVLIYLIEHAGSTQSDIANFKNFSAPTINWHMSRLIEAGIVTFHREWKTVAVFY